MWIDTALYADTNKKIRGIFMAVAHKGSISMGLVLIPIGMYKATADNDIHFNQLEKKVKHGSSTKSIVVIVEKRLPVQISSKATNMRKTNMLL